MVSKAQLKPTRQKGASHAATGGRTWQKDSTAHVKVGAKRSVRMESAEVGWVQQWEIRLGRPGRC